MKKYVLIWIVATFFITSIIGFGIINPMIEVTGFLSYVVSVAEFVVVGLLIYKPIKSMWG